MKPKYHNLREEFFANASRSTFETVDHRSSWSILEKRVERLLEQRITRSLRSNGKYGIPKGQPIDEEHLMALLIHTDLTKVNTEYCNILRRGNPDEISFIAHWTRLLMETVQCFGAKIDPKQKYHRGMDKVYEFTNMAIRCDVPMSTSISVSDTHSVYVCVLCVFVSLNFVLCPYLQRNAALKFTGPHGMTLTLQQHDNKCEVIAFDCTPFSAFPEERETLFFGETTVVKIHNIFRADARLRNSL